MDLAGFNPQQIEAITLPVLVSELSDVLIIAGAGSGKTRVLINRINYLVENGVDGGQIVALTFTRKAANEMRDRLKDLPNYSTKTKMSTFHSLAVDILKEFSDSNFEIIDETDKKKLVKSILAREEFKTDVSIKEFISYLSYKRNLCENPYDVEEGDDLSIIDYKNLAKIYREEKKKIGHGGAFDFDDLVEQAVLLLARKKGVQRLLHRRWKYLLIDEYQDTNKIQYKFLSLIRGAQTQLLQVGDEDQLIYSWRGADISHILSSYKESVEGNKVKCVVLNTNYRCSANILEVANSIVAVNQKRTGKKLVANNPDGEPVRVREFYSSFDEADAISAQIKKWHSRGVDFDSIAILVRANMIGRSAERALIKNKVPYFVHNGTALFDTKEVRLVTSLLKLTENPKEVFYLDSIIDVIKLGIGNKALEKIRSSIKDSDLDVIEYLKLHPTHSANERVKKLIELMPRAKSLLKDGLIKDCANHWLLKFELMNFFKEDDRDKRMDSCLLFFEVLDDYEHEKSILGEKVSIADFQEQRLINDDLVKKGEISAVHIMSIHKAKGLEFDYGFVVGVQDGIFPKELTSDGLIEEEDVRLAYVAVTRFKKEMWITKSMERVGYKGISSYSSLVDDLPDRLFEQNIIVYD